MSIVNQIKFIGYFSGVPCNIRVVILYEVNKIKVFTMSLLEDVFLQDEADEAQELERVIEGDEYDERARSRSATPEEDENVIGEDEAEEEKRRIDPTSTSSKTKRVIKNPRFILNPARLTGPRGIQVIRDHFKDFKFKGKGHEKEDLDMVLKKLEHWAYRLYPKFQFEDCLKKIETLGKKRPVMVHLSKIRSDQILTEETVVQKDSSDDDTQNEPPQEEDEFDKLLQQQIEIARATPAPGSVKKLMDTPRQERSPFTMPKATSSPSISNEQKERMIRNRKLAEERRLARLEKLATEASTAPSINIIDVDGNTTEHNAAKKNRSNVIDSSDEECNVSAVQSVSVDLHVNTSSSQDKVVDRSTESKDIEIEGTVDIDMEVREDNRKTTNVEEVTDQEKVNDEEISNNKVIGESVDVSNVVNKDNMVRKDVEEITDQEKNIDNVDEDIAVNNGENIDRNIEENQETEQINNEVTQYDVSTENAKIPEMSVEDSANISNNENQVQPSKDVIGEEGIVDSEENISKNIENDGKENTAEVNKNNMNETNEVEDIMDVDFSDDF
ncbi:unnamed protein product [Chrysodeixis includens]|uniref:TIMELESS-interacting protein n=1 Tax=Chrysodeixis includens TaxID=689277 RepID=A0A9P0FX56_CHRIL|nr:unnamed protein product [Chrysodeixis includens]